MRSATVPFVYRFYPLVREARARVANGFGPVRLIHGTYLQDWLSTEDDDNWRVDPAFAGPSRAFADIGSHWCDLVEFVTGDRLAAVCAELVTAVPERRFGGEHAHAFGSGAQPGGSRRSVTTEDMAIVMFRTVAGVAGSVVISQISSGRKNRLFFEIAGAEATLAFDQEQPETLWVGRRRGDRDRAIATQPIWIRRPRPTQRFLRVIRRATRTASMPSSPTPIAPSRPARSTRSTVCRASPTASGPP